MSTRPTDPAIVRLTRTLNHALRTRFIWALMTCLVVVACAGAGSANLEASGAGLRDALQHLENLAAQRYNPQAAARVNRWITLLERVEGQDELSQARAVNDFFNRELRYTDDQVTWGREDYWATPLEAMGKAAGDCEDYSIAKFVSLRKLGVPEERLRLFYVRARMGGPASRITQAHMVLGYFPSDDAEPLILDNLITRIERASLRDDLTPIFSFNSQGLWPDGTRQSAADPTARLSQWRRVLDQMERDGIDITPSMTDRTQ